MPAHPPFSRSGMPRAAALRTALSDGSLSPAGLRRAMELCGHVPSRKEWRDFLARSATALGILCFSFAVIFFIAWNWSGLHMAVKFGLLQAAIFGLGLMAVRHGLFSASGQALLLGCGMVFGPLLAQIGQSWQAGWDTWMLYAAWAAVTICLAFLGSNLWLWILAWLAAGFALFSWSAAGYHHWSDCLFADPSLALFQLAVVLLGETARALFPTFRQSPWPVRLAAMAALFALTCLGCAAVLERYQGTLHLLGLSGAGLAVLGLWAWFRARDSLVFGSVILSVAVLLVCALFSWDHVFRMTDSLTLCALLSSGILAGAGALALRAQRCLGPMGTESSPAAPCPDGSGPASGWSGLSARLRTEGLLPDGRELHVPEPVPLGTRVLLGLGGWLSSLFLLVALLALFFLFAGGMRDGKLLAVPGLTALACGVALAPSKNCFVGQFGLAAATAGTVLLDLVCVFEAGWPQASVLAALVNFAAMAVVRNRAFRAAAVFVAVSFLMAGAHHLVIHLLTGFYRYFQSPLGHLPLQLADACLALVILFPLLWLWIREIRFAIRPGQGLLAPAVTGIFALLLLVCLCPGLFESGALFRFMRFSPSSWAICQAAGLGIILLTREIQGKAAFLPTLAVGIVLILLQSCLPGLLPPSQSLPIYPQFLVAAAIILVTGCYCASHPTQRGNALTLGTAFLSIPLSAQVPGLNLVLLGLLAGKATGRPALLAAGAFFSPVFALLYFFLPHPGQSVKSGLFLLLGCGLWTGGCYLNRRIACAGEASLTTDRRAPAGNENTQEPKCAKNC